MNHEIEIIHLLDHPEKVVGRLAWQVIDCDLDQVMGKGDREFLVRDVRAEYLGQELEMKAYQVPLSSHIALVIASSKDDRGGFGLSLKHDQSEIFSWEWFLVDGKVATNQEKGKLDLEFQESRISRIEFQSDISLRGYPLLDTHDFENPKWRVWIRKGSTFSVPS